MKLKEFQCKECGSVATSGSAFHKLCTLCNKIRLKAGKQQKNYSFKFKKSKPKVKRRKPTGEREMFIEIWNERPHICCHCKDPLGHEPIVHYFSHIKPKGKYPELRLVKSNVELLCIECHRKYDFGGL